MKTQVAIIGGGPAGLLLSEILHRQGVSSVVLEQRSRAYVLARIRAGILEQTTVDLLRANGLAERMDAQGHAHDGTRLVWGGRGLVNPDSLVWGGRGQVGADSLVWGGRGQVSADSLVWGGRGQVSADSLIWGGSGNLDGTVDELLDLGEPSILDSDRSELASTGLLWGGR